MHDTLAGLDEALFRRNSVLGLLARDAATKRAPERWQALTGQEVASFDIVVCFESRVFDLVVEGTWGRCSEHTIYVTLCVQGIREVGANSVLDVSFDVNPWPRARHRANSQYLRPVLDSGCWVAWRLLSACSRRVSFTCSARESSPYGFVGTCLCVGYTEWRQQRRQHPLTVDLAMHNPSWYTTNLGCTLSASLIFPSKLISGYRPDMQALSLLKLD